MVRGHAHVPANLVLRMDCAKTSPNPVQGLAQVISNPFVGVDTYWRRIKESKPGAVSSTSREEVLSTPGRFRWCPYRVPSLEHTCRHMTVARSVIRARRIALQCHKSTAAQRVRCRGKGVRTQVKQALGRYLVSLLNGLRRRVEVGLPKKRPPSRTASASIVFPCYKTSKY